MSRARVTGKTEILGDFIGKDEVEAALQGSHSDREAMARRIASSLGYNGHLAYVQGDDVGVDRWFRFLFKPSEDSPARYALGNTRNFNKQFRKVGHAATGESIYMRR